MNLKAHEAVSKISDDEWRGIALELERYAFSVSRSLRWRTRNPTELPGGETVDSIVSKAIEKLFVGDRDWEPDKEPNIKNYLKGVIDSLLNHLAESKENTLLTAVTKPGSVDAPAWEGGSPKRDPAADWLVPTRPSPERTLLMQEESALKDRALDLLIDECADDNILIEVLEAMMDGADTSAEISKTKGIPIKDVYNATKRLDRKLEKVRGRIASEQNAAVSGEDGL